MKRTEMCLHGKETKQIQTKCDSNMIFDLFRHCPNTISKFSPQVHACDLQEGQWGSVGSIICWTFKLDGKTVFAKQRVTAVDDENKTIQWKAIEGVMMGAYKSFFVTIQSLNNSMICSIEYEKMNECIPNPTAYLDSFENIIKDINLNYQAIPKLSTN